MDFFAKNIRHLRESRNLKQAEICANTGFKQSTWSGYEKGTSKPNYNDLLLIIEYFGITASELIELDLSNVHLIENSQDGKKGQNVHLNVHPNVHLNEKKSRKGTCQECKIKDNYIAIKDQLTHSQNSLIDSLKTQIELLQNQIEQMKIEIRERDKTPVPQHRERKTA